MSDVFSSELGDADAYGRGQSIVVLVTYPPFGDSRRMEGDTFSTRLRKQAMTPPTGRLRRRDFRGQRRIRDSRNTLSRGKAKQARSPSDNQPTLRRSATPRPIRCSDSPTATRP